MLAFETAAHRGSFTLAGRDLSVSQSAVSHQVLALEQALDVSLFRRLPRQLELTDAGRSLLSRVSPALDALEAAMLELASSKGEGGTLELGVVPTFATKWLIPRLPLFLKAHPHVTLNLSTRLLPFDFSLTGLDAAIHYGRPDLDLADPRFKGKVVFQSLSSSTFGLHGFLLFNRIQGGTDKNVEPGFKAGPATVGPNVLEYIQSSAKLAEMVQTGEAAIFPLTPPAVGVLKTKGLPVEYVQPKEGPAVLTVGECVIAKNSEPALAHKLAEYLLSPQAQAQALEFGDQIPSNPKTKATGAAAALVTQMNEYMKTAIAVDWDVINENRPAWNARWNKTVDR